MAVRKIHNKIAKMVVPQASMQTIDAVNKDVDDPYYLNKYGRYHRKYHGHDLNPYSKDSLSVNKGNPTLEKIRQVHIIVDTSPRIKSLVKQMEIRDQIKKLRSGK